MSIALTPTVTAVITVCAQIRNTVLETGAGGHPRTEATFTQPRFDGPSS